MTHIIGCRGITGGSKPAREPQFAVGYRKIRCRKILRLVDRLPIWADRQSWGAWPSGCMWEWIVHGNCWGWGVGVFTDNHGGIVGTPIPTPPHPTRRPRRWDQPGGSGALRGGQQTQVRIIPTISPDDAGHSTRNICSEISWLIFFRPAPAKLASS